MSSPPPPTSGPSSHSESRRESKDEGVAFSKISSTEHNRSDAVPPWLSDGWPSFAEAIQKMGIEEKKAVIARMRAALTAICVIKRAPGAEVESTYVGCGTLVRHLESDYVLANYHLLPDVKAITEQKMFAIAYTKEERPVTLNFAVESSIFAESDDWRMILLDTRNCSLATKGIQPLALKTPQPLIDNILFVPQFPVRAHEWIKDMRQQGHSSETLSKWLKAPDRRVWYVEVHCGTEWKEAKAPDGCFFHQSITMPGSGGSPILSSNGDLIGLHQALVNIKADNLCKVGIRIERIIDALALMK